MKIDTLLEKFLTSYSSPKTEYGCEVFVNPTASEFREVIKVSDNFKAARFIIDLKNKNVYIWGANLMLHLPMWEKLMKELGDSRRLYNDGTLLSGEITSTKDYDFYSMTLNDQKHFMHFYIDDFKWADKYLPNVEHEAKHELKSQIWDTNKVKLRSQGYEI